MKPLTMYGLRSASFLLILLHGIPLGAQPAWRHLGDLSMPRSFHNALYIGDDNVLVMGGLRYLAAGPHATAHCELIDTRTGRITTAAWMNHPRAEFIALLTPDSNVVVVSGLAGVDRYGVLTPTVEMYDRASGRWRVLGSLQTARRQHVAAFINEREILVVGGRHENHATMADAEIFDIKTGTSRPAARFPFVINSASMGCASNGDPIVLGGREAGPNSGRVSTVYRYDIAGDGWEVSGRLSSPMQGTQMLKLRDGRLLVSGGSYREEPLDFSREVQMETGGIWRVVGLMQSERQWSSAAQWNDDTVMTIGGFDNYPRTLLTTDWVNLRTGRIGPGPMLNEGRSYFQAVAVPWCFDRRGRVRGVAILAIGGRVNIYSPLVATGSVEILEPTCVTTDVDAGPDVTVCPGYSVELGGAPTSPQQFPPVSYRWEPAEGLNCTDCSNPTATPEKTTVYTVTVTDGRGISSSSSCTVTMGSLSPRAHIDKTLTAKPGDPVDIDLILDNPIDAAHITGFTSRIYYDTTKMLPVLPILLDGTIAAGWNPTVLSDRDGVITIRVEAPTSTEYLRGTGSLLRLRVRTFIRAGFAGDVTWRDTATIPFDLQFDDSVCIRARTDPGFLRLSICGLSERLIELLPDSFGRLSSRPNPFHHSTELGFSIPVDGWTTLVIVDAAGNRVERLVDGPMNAGKHSLIWDASGLAPGLYFCRLGSGEWSETRAMMLMK